MGIDPRLCDHPDYEVIKETLFGMRNVEYVCTRCEQAFGSVDQLRQDRTRKASPAQTYSPHDPEHNASRN